MFSDISSYNTYVFECCFSVLTQPQNRFVTRLLSCRWYLVRSQLRNPLALQMCQVATVVMETPKPHSWF